MTVSTSIRLGLVAVAAAAGLAAIPSPAAARALSSATEYSASNAESTAPQTPGDADSGASLLKKGSFDVTE